MDIVQIAFQYKPVVDSVTALVGPVTAIAVAFVAFQQWKTNKQKEDRQIRQAELSVYHRVRRFLRAVDEARNVDTRLFEEFREAVADADFLFSPHLCQWLGIIEGEASSWLDGNTRISQWMDDGNDAAAPWIGREQGHMERSIDAIQNAHAELLSRFKTHVRAL